MKEKSNVYIECLKKGNECRENGISYWEMINHLDSKKLIDVNSLLFHEYFFTWFYDNFYYRTTYMDRRQNRTHIDKNQTAATQTPNEALMFRQTYLAERFLDPSKEENILQMKNITLHEKAFMMFDAQQNYFNYLSLKESESKTTIANRLSWTAIGITITTSVISIIIGCLQLGYADRQEKVSNAINTANQTNEQSQSLCIETKSDTLQGQLFQLRTQQDKCEDQAKFDTTNCKNSLGNQQNNGKNQ